MSSSVKLKNTYAAKQFMKSINQNLSNIEERLDKLIIKIAEDTVKRVQDYIRLNYYVAYPEGDNYERLGMNGGFMGAITYEYNKSTRQVKIKFDSSLLTFGHKGSKKYPSHIENRKPFTEGLYDYMMYGEFPSYKNNTVAPDFLGLNYDEKMDNEISDWLSDYATGKIKEELKKEGLSFEGLSHVN